MHIRPRRNRKNEVIRNLVKETYLGAEHLIAPLFVVAGTNQKIAIKSMPDCFRLSIDNLIIEARELFNLGVKTIALFPAVDESLKTPDAREAYNPNNINHQAIRALKEAIPEMMIMGDIALDPYSSDGHDGIVDPKTGEILNDPSLEVLAKMAVAQAHAGVDIVGPSDMMDGRISYIRNALDKEGFTNISIMSYTAKYASAFYGPFRDALDSAPKKGDKKTYQMNFANAREAIREAELDEMEGADILMVKPGLPYLDIILRLKEHSNLPIAAYNISGEYAMVKAAAQNGWIDENKAVLEVLTSFRRAGADIILTYHAKLAAQLLSK